MDFWDIAITGAIFLLVFGWDNAKKTLAPSEFERKKHNFYVQYRMLGKDNARGEDIRKELRLRGIVDLPEFVGDDTDYETMGTLEALLDTVPAIPPQVKPQETLFPLVRTYPDTLFNRVADQDDT